VVGEKVKNCLFVFWSVKVFIGRGSWKYKKKIYIYFSGFSTKERCENTAIAETSAS
jgi:hypothetical protein